MVPIMPLGVCKDCVHLRFTVLATHDPDGFEYMPPGRFTWTCEAFPRGIPHKIRNGNERHDTPRRGQKGKTVFTRGYVNPFAPGE